MGGSKADKVVGTDTIVKAVMYRSDVDVCRLDRPKVPLRNCEVFARGGDPGDIELHSPKPGVRFQPDSRSNLESCRFPYALGKHIYPG